MSGRHHQKFTPKSVKILLECCPLLFKIFLFRSNTGFFIMNHKTVTSTSELTFAHEVGHNMGAFHDSQRSCLGSSYFGNYLMYPSIASKRQPNNDKFSQCSQRSILRTLGQLLEGRRNNCFQNTEPRRTEALVGRFYIT